MRVKAPFQSSLEDGSKGDSLDTGRSSVNLTSDQGQQEQPAEPDWMGIARDAHSTSTRWVDSSLRAQWERNIRMFQSKHPPGSKFFSDSYKGRSKIFRPKTRSMIRSGEAQVAASYFSNPDVVSVKAADDSDPLQVASAEVNKALLFYRLTTPNRRVAIPWFQTVVGAYQTAQTMGFVASKQWWEYRERVIGQQDVPVNDPATGQPLMSDLGAPITAPQPITDVLFDRPRCDLIPPENIRIDPASDWIDPVNTSPYVIIETPWYVAEVEAQMREIDPITKEPKFLTVARGGLMAATGRETYDSTRSQRHDKRLDPQQAETTITEFSTVWIHENFVRWNNEDWVYHTAGIHHLLSKPRRVDEVYRHVRYGERPVVLGCCLIEAFKNLPSGKPELAAGLQTEANDLANLRLDNIKLAINKRFLAKRGRQTDLKSLVRGTPGAVTLVNDVEDVKEMETRDVTQGAFVEQNLINNDMDDVLGNYSAGTIQTNRKMNETVGGMQMLRGAANLISELDLKVFTVTWAEPVVSQIIRMEQIYESDARVLALAQKNAQKYQRGQVAAHINNITDELLAQDLTTAISVGIGATDPEMRLKKFLVGLEALEKLIGPEIGPQIDIIEITKEIFSIQGYRDGMRFFKFNNQDPLVPMLMKKIEGMQQQIDGKQMESDTKMNTAQIAAIARVLSQVEANEGNIATAQVKAGANIETAHISGQLKLMQEAIKQILAPKPEPASGG